ncbi:retrovirus-related pol polyprotein from transposon TNT 1-94 [Tanacetum coccineum]
MTLPLCLKALELTSLPIDFENPFDFDLGQWGTQNRAGNANADQGKLDNMSDASPENGCIDEEDYSFWMVEQEHLLMEMTIALVQSSNAQLGGMRLELRSNSTFRFRIMLYGSMLMSQSMFAALKLDLEAMEASKKTQKASTEAIFTHPEDLNVKFLRSLPSEWDTHMDSLMFAGFLIGVTWQRRNSGKHGTLGILCSEDNMTVLIWEKHVLKMFNCLVAKATLKNQCSGIGDGPKSVFYLDSLTQSLNYVPVVCRKIFDLILQGIQGVSEFSYIFSTEDKDELHDEDDATEESDDGSNLKENGTADLQVNTARPDINTGSREVSTALPKVNTATLEDLVRPSPASEDSHILVDLPKGHRAIGTKWVYRNKKDERGIVIRNKARLVAQGHTQEEGIYYDEVFALVAQIEAIRIFLDYASYMRFMLPRDVKSAFLYVRLRRAPELDASYFDDASPKIVPDAQIEDKDELHDEDDATEESHDGSSLKENGTVDQQVTTARPQVLEC